MGGDGAGVGTGPLSEEEAERIIRSRIASHRRYPALARHRGVEGVVTLSLLHRADGTVDVQVVRGADPMLDEAARRAVLSSAPLPRFRDGLRIELEYRLSAP